MHNDAQIAKDNARAQLGKLEQSLYEAKKERDAKLDKCKKQAEEKKEHAEKIEKRVNIFRLKLSGFECFYNAVCINTSKIYCFS